MLGDPESCGRPCIPVGRRVEVPRPRVTRELGSGSLRFPRAVLSGVVALLEDPDIGQAGPVAAEESGAPLLDQPVALGAPGIRGDHRAKLARTLQERLTLIDHHDVRHSRRAGLRRETQRGQAHGG